MHSQCSDSRSVSDLPERPGRPDAASRRLAMLATDLGAAPASGDGCTDRTQLGAGWLPRPGRHAARRRLGWLTGRSVPEVGAAHVAVLAVIVAVSIAGTAWWLLRDSPEPLEQTAPPPAVGSVEPLVAQSSGTAASPTGDGSVTVDVAGEVRRPGIVVLDSGARVVDALKAAGGVRRGVDTTGLNLARILVDGEQIVVGQSVAAASPPAAAATGTAGAAAGPATLVNLNVADQAALESLPQVGPVTATAIITWRDENGGFSSVDELLEVDGIGEKTLAQLAPLVTV